MNAAHEATVFHGDDLERFLAGVALAVLVLAIAGVIGLVRSARGKDSSF